MTTWRLKKGADRRVRNGHPWVFDTDLQAPPKGHAPGAPVDLQDDQGQFVARGYGNLESTISFRAVSFDSSEKNPLGRTEMLIKVLQCWTSRRRMGLSASARLVFSECDLLPGLIIDRYLLARPDGDVQVFATQILTAGMSKALGETEKFFEQLVKQAQDQGLCEIPWERTAVVLRNDVHVRELEGLREEPARFIKSVREIDFTNARIRLNAATGTGFIEMFCDLFQGQKTGFFLDQTANIAALCRFLERDPDLPKDRPVRVLDLCCYVGHWSTQIAHTLRARGIKVETTLADVSARALDYARRNAESEGATVIVREMDVLKKLETLSPGFDIIIADPPAFAKARKDIPTASHAYMKLNSQAFRLVNSWGYVVSCSCSGLVTEGDFKTVIAKALRRSNVDARLVARGGPAPDHPGRLSFPDGHYLKMLIHQMGVVDQTRSAGTGSAGADAGD